MIISKDITEKIIIGEGFTDEELNKAINFYSNLCDSIKCLGIRYDLVFCDLFHALDNLQSIRYFREKRNEQEQICKRI